MRTVLNLAIQAQPDEFSCGPTCLHALYRYYGESAGMPQLMREVKRLKNGGTLIEILACHALKRGFNATIYTYHLHMFDPTWFADDGLVHNPGDVSERLEQQLAVKKSDQRLKLATRATQEFLALGGELKMLDLTGELISRYLHAKVPIIAGLSSTYLYRQPREFGPKGDEDDVRGEPQGHFVMLIGYDGEREVLVADPLDPNPPFHTAKYRLPVDRLLNAILLGILTHDANLLIITPKARKRGAAKGK